MQPERTKTINGRKIEEYYWGGKMTTYVNNYLVEMNFEKACKACYDEWRIDEVMWNMYKIPFPN